MKRITILIFFFLTAFISKAQLVSETRQSNSFSLSGVIYVDNADHALVRKSAGLLQLDKTRLSRPTGNNKMKLAILIL